MLRIVGERECTLKIRSSYNITVCTVRDTNIYGKFALGVTPLTNKVGSCPSQLQSLAKDLQLAGVEGQRVGKLCSSGEGGTDCKDLHMYVWLRP